MSIKLIATDLDGTLLQSDHWTVSQKNIDALAEASRLGVKIVIASGRTWSVLSHVPDQLETVDYAIISNGAAIMDPQTQTRTVVREIPYETWKPIYDLLVRKHAGFEIYCQGQTYSGVEEIKNFENPHINENLVAELCSHIAVVDDLGVFLKDQSIEKINAMYIPADNYHSVYNELQQSPEICITNSLPSNIEITASETHKGTALQKLCDSLGIHAGEVMAFGDANNDLEMLQWAGWSFAMANASPQVAAVAHYRALSSDDHGVAQAIEQYIFD